MTVKISLSWTVPVNVLLSNTWMPPNHRRFPAPLPEWFLLISKMERRTNTGTSTTTRMLHPECTNGASSSVRILEMTWLQGIFKKICSGRIIWKFRDSELGVGLFWHSYGNVLPSVLLRTAFICLKSPWQRYCFVSFHLQMNWTIWAALKGSPSYKKNSRRYENTTCPWSQK